MSSFEAMLLGHARHRCRAGASRCSFENPRRFVALRQVASRVSIGFLAGAAAIGF